MFSNLFVLFKFMKNLPLFLARSLCEKIINKNVSNFISLWKLIYQGATFPTRGQIYSFLSQVLFNQRELTFIIYFISDAVLGTLHNLYSSSMKMRWYYPHSI